jgi:hypothetical protein
MRRYIGCDVHATSCTLAIKDPRGRRLGRDVVETNGRALVDYVLRIVRSPAPVGYASRPWRVP